MPISRRQFLATAPAAAMAAAAVPSALVAGCASDAPIRAARAGPGLQLYTIRAEMARDVSAALARVAAIGFRDVEFAGYFDLPPERIPELLAGHGLAAPSAHVDFAELRSSWPRTLDVAARAGHSYVTVPWIDAGDRRTADDWRRIADLFNARGAEARDSGLRFAYHNHDFEFATVGDVVPLELLLERTDPDAVALQLDTYWAVKAGADVVDLLTRHAGRVVMTHLKDSAGAPGHRMVDVGAGTLDFAAILAASDAAGVQHHFIEHDEPTDAFASAAAGFSHIAGLQHR